MRKFIFTLLAAAAFQTAAAQLEPKVVTDTRFARGNSVAFFRGTFTATATNTITERGVCYSSTSKEPTVDDMTSKLTITQAGTIYYAKDLKPATVYYFRAYAKAKNGAVGYGDVVKVVTLPAASIGWVYDNGADAAANDRINAAVKGCVDYWSQCTSINGLYLNVHYGSGTPTADCSYGGWMRVGPNQSYQRTGTIMHEALHAVGVGQDNMWYGSSSPLRAGSGTGRWLGDRATELIRFWDNNNSATVNGDGTHVWPYGINGANEDNGTVTLYYACSLLAQALGEDGLPLTRTFNHGQPYYSFDQEDDVKYYIKCESKDYGFNTHYLVDKTTTTTGATHSVSMKSMTAAEALADDAAAWYITFTPDNQYYQLRNAKTGYYLSFSSAAFNLRKTTTPADAENFQLQRSRIDVTSESGALITTKRGYWIEAASQAGSDAPLSLAATGTTAVSAQARNFVNSAANQRWVILTADDAQTIEKNTLSALSEDFGKMRQVAESMLATPHIDVTAGTTKVLTDTIAALQRKVDAATKSSDITSATTSMFNEIKKFMRGACVKDLEKPFNLTALLTNPAFATDKSGWLGNIDAGSWANQEVEYYQKDVNVYQTLKTMPKGTYDVRLKAFQRPGSNTNAYNDFIGGTNNAEAKLYAKSTATSVIIKNVMAERSATQVNSGDTKLADNTYVPNNMAAAAAHFAKGRYDNRLDYYHTAAGDLKLGLVSTTNTGTNYWTIFTDLRLNYYGPLTLDDIKAKIAEDATRGDVNGDGVVNIEDANAIVNHFLGINPEPFDEKAADINGDNNITISDANGVVNKYLDKK